jgi:hypothetical protein|tara:strand:+ start:260 stop:637 length:378 start_codon:yes stop_codon:yes gene_type:complete
MKTFQEFINEASLDDWYKRGKNKRIRGEDKASISRLFKDDLAQVGKFTNPTTGKLEGGMFPNPIKPYQMKQFALGQGGITRSFNPFLGPGKGLRSGPTPLGRRTFKGLGKVARIATRIATKGKFG